MPKDLPPQWRAADSTETAAVDSGACDSIAHPASFPHTPLHKTSETGKQYGACGGNAVTNIGTKHVHFVPHNGKHNTITFQVGDKITRNLLAVSSLCAAGKTVVFGPAPTYTSYISNDPDTFTCHNGDITKINIKNGVYEINMKEIYQAHGVHAVTPTGAVSYTHLTLPTNREV